MGAPELGRSGTRQVRSTGTVLIREKLNHPELNSLAASRYKKKGGGGGGGGRRADKLELEKNLLQLEHTMRAQHR